MVLDTAHGRTGATPVQQPDGEDVSDYRLAIAVALVTGLLAVGCAVVLGLPLRDPDGIFGPSYVRLPLIVALVLAVDVLPRAAWRARDPRRLWTASVEVVRQRWPWRRLAVVLVGLGSFYVTYVGYRNLKSFLPFIRQERYDDELLALDRWMTGGVDPAVMLHELLGTGAAAYVLSWVYLFYLFFVPFSLAFALVWNDDMARGSWYVTALCLNWALGTLSYYLLPSLGPVYVRPWTFFPLPPTETEGLQHSLMRARIEVLADPHATQRVHGIAAFASLHVSIVFTAALVGQLVRLPVLVRIALWLFFVLTVLATIYFGWHYLIDDIAGVVIGGVAVLLAGWGTGQFRPPPPATGGRMPRPGTADPRAAPTG